MHVVIAGSSGLIGSALKSLLLSQGHTVTALSRKSSSGKDDSLSRFANYHTSYWDPVTGEIDESVIEKADAVVNLAGISIGDKRLNKKHAAAVLKSRIDSTETLVSALLQADSHPRLIQGSAMGYYGFQEDLLLEESLPAGDSLLARISLRWEAAALPYASAGGKVVWIRSGLVLAPNGGFASRLMPLIKTGMIAKFGSGKAKHAWITLADEVRAIEHLINSPDVSGPYNLIAPEVVVNHNFLQTLNQTFTKRKGFVRIPAWLIRTLIGPAASELLESQRGSSEKLAASGFVWDYPTFAKAADWLFATSTLDDK